jgi:hypothetical protein
MLAFVLLLTAVIMLPAVPTPVCAWPIDVISSDDEGEDPGLRWKGLGILGTIPHHSYGLFYVHTGTNGRGVYIDAKLTLPEIQNEDNYYDMISIGMAQDLGDLLVDFDSNWITVDVALVGRAGRHMLFYAGLGISWEKRFREYFDPMKFRGWDGHYWIDDENRRATHLNLMGGMMTGMLGDVRLLLGAETKPLQVDLGLALKL